MRRIIKRLRKGLKTACLTVTLATCWGVGQQAQAAEIELQNTVDMYRFTGIVEPTANDLSKLLLIYGTGNSYIFTDGPYVVSIGDFSAGASTSFDVTGEACAGERELWWMAVGLYGDISSGKYNTDGSNGVTVSLNPSSAGYNWNSIFDTSDEETVFDYVYNEDIENLKIWAASEEKLQYDSDYEYEFSDSCTLYDFSEATANGTITFDVQVVPEPVSVILAGIGGIMVMRKRHAKK